MRTRRIMRKAILKKRWVRAFKKAQCQKVSDEDLK